MRNLKRKDNNKCIVIDVKDRKEKHKVNNNKITGLYAILAVVSVAIAGTTFSNVNHQQAYASHSFELGVQGSSISDNTHIVLDGIKLKKGEVLPLYDASPNFIAGHLLVKLPCDDENVPKVTVIAGHIDEHHDGTYVDKVPLYYISHASDADSCTYHAHVPDPLNGGAPRVTDIDIVNYKGSTVKFNDGDAVDLNVQRTLGNIKSNPYASSQLPGSLEEGNPVFDVNDDNPNNDGLGFIE